MGKLIAVAGKGGTGKTTVAALIIHHLLKTKRTPVLAVDADPNYTLGDALGIKVEQTIGMLREQFIGERTQIPSGMSKDAVLERQMHAALHESKGVDLVVMGRQEGPGCYCALNNILRGFLDQLADDYPYVVVDNEAGMEHLSRRNTKTIDLLLVVADHSMKSVRAASRIMTLVEELSLESKKQLLVLNKVPKNAAEEILSQIDGVGIPILATLKQEPAIAQADIKGLSLASLPADLESVHVFDSAIEKTLLTL